MAKRTILLSSSCLARCEFSDKALLSGKDFAHHEAARPALPMRGAGKRDDV